MRIVVDSKQNGVSKATRKFERTQLPGLMHVVQDSLELMVLNPGTEAESFVCDYKDAFHSIPNHKDESRFFCVCFRGEYYVFVTTTQGSRGAPLTWSRTAALLGRLTQALVDARLDRINTYVDDPIMTCIAQNKNVT